MPQRATIESIPEAFTMLKQMRGQEVEWGEDYREAGALALKAVLEQGMAARIDRHLEEMAERGEADRRLNNEWSCEPPMPSNADSAKFVDAPDPWVSSRIEHLWIVSSSPYSLTKTGPRESLSSSP